jgi:hypothetical protein
MTIRDSLEQASCSDSNVIGAIGISLKEAIESLSPEEPFVSFDIGLTEADTELLGKLQINKSRTLGQLCNLSSCKNLYGQAETVTDFLNYLSADNDKIAIPMVNLFTKLISNVVSQSQYSGQSYDVKIVAYKPNEPYAIDWHVDPAWGIDKGCEYTTIVNLKGPCTLFCPPEAVQTINGDKYSFSCDIKEFTDCIDGRSHVFLSLHRASKHRGALHAWPFTEGARLVMLVSAHCPLV